MPCYQELLDKWATRRNLGQLSMHTNTNCTVFNVQFWNSVKRFHSRQIDFSIDATGDAYERIRYTSWDKIQTNMLKIRDYLSDSGRNIFCLNIVAQLANLDQGIELQALYDELCSASSPRVQYQALILPVTNFPEWSWHNIPLDILQPALSRLEGHRGTVIDSYRTGLELAIQTNKFNYQHAERVLYKERWFEQQQKPSLWDTNSAWKEIYTNLLTDK